MLNPRYSCVIDSNGLFSPIYGPLHNFKDCSSRCIHQQRVWVYVVSLYGMCADEPLPSVHDRFDSCERSSLVYVSLGLVAFREGHRS